MNRREPNRWQGFILGAAGAMAGVVAMRYYWRAVSALAGGDPRAQAGNPEPHALDSIALFGDRREEGESSTAAMGRIAYRLIAGKEPESPETRATLSYLVHWIYSMLMGGLYGALRDTAGPVDLEGGVALGLGVWLFGDGSGDAALGVAGGPTSYPLALHAHAVGAHLAYGLATSATTQVLRRLS